MNSGAIIAHETLTNSSHALMLPYTNPTHDHLYVPPVL